MRIDLSKPIAFSKYEGPCLWCRQHVVSGRKESGATNPLDAAWMTPLERDYDVYVGGGDFGCDQSPETCEDGCGGHARPYDLAILLLQGE